MESQTDHSSSRALQGSRAAGIAAAVVTVLIVVGGIGYVAWAKFGGPRQDELVEVQPNIAQRIAGGAGMRPRRPSETARVTNKGVVANAGDVHLDAVKPTKDKPWKLSVSYNRTDLATPPQNAALTARFRLPVDAAFVKSLKVTPDQISQLNAVEVGITMPLNDGERTKLGDLCQAYFDAKDKAASQTELVKYLEGLGPAKLAATKQSVADRTAAIEKILTPEQIKPFMAK